MGRLKTDTWERMLEQMEQEGVGFYLNGKKTAPREESSAKSGTMK